MDKRNQNTVLHSYNIGAMLLHWIIALLIIVQLIMGFSMMHISAISDVTRFSMIQWHKTFGILVLVFTIMRIVWRIMNPPPPHAPMKKIEEMTANIVVFLFYALMLLVPITGWVIVSTSPTAIPTLFFKISGLVWPNLPINKDAAVEHFAQNAHMYLAYSFVVLLFLHIGGALKHVVIDRVDEISRMVPTQKLPRNPTKKVSSFVSAIIFIVLIAGGLIIGQIANQRNVSTPTVSQAVTTNSSSQVTNANWIIDQNSSNLGFTLEFSGSEKEGKVGKWNAEVAFDPDNLEQAKAEIILDSSSISYDDSYVAGSLHEADGLDTQNYPTINVLLDKFQHVENDQYLATGTITIRGVSLDVEVPFTFDETNNTANVHGSATLERLAFGIGQQNDNDGQWLGKTINVKFDIKAQSK